MANPAAAPPPQPPLAWAISNQLRHMLGLRQTIVVRGVRYRERTREPLRHALSRKGPGFKEYSAYFREGPPLRITATASRTYADLAGPRLLPAYQRAEDWLTPGLRALLLEGGTGYAAQWAAERVGPSGAVVSLDRDDESATFARRRYPLPNVAFERGGLESLSGETEGAFDAVFAVDAFRPEDDVRATLAELWRVIGPGGWIYVALPGDPDSPASGRAAEISALLRLVCNPELPPATEGEVPGPERESVKVASEDRDGWITVVAKRPAEE